MSKGDPHAPETYKGGPHDSEPHPPSLSPPTRGPASPGPEEGYPPLTGWPHLLTLARCTDNPSPPSDTSDGHAHKTHKGDRHGLETYKANLHATE